MTREEAKQYAREYRQEGFGAVNDRRYYLLHRDEILKKARDKYHKMREIYRKKVIK